MKSSDTRPSVYSLSAFDQCQITDDRKGFPMSFYLRANFKGLLNKDVFEGAVRKTMLRHPLLQSIYKEKCKIFRSKNKMLPLAVLSMPRITYAKTSKLHSFEEASNYLDLSREIGLRIYVNESNSQTVILFKFHHTIADATGGCQIIDDLLVHYHCQMNGSNPDTLLQPLDRSLQELPLVVERTFKQKIQ